MLKKILTTLVMLYAAASFAAVDVNKATAAELDGIKGIGPGLSGKIIEERKHGAFKDWDDFIQRVRGVGETSAGKFSAEGMWVNGRTFKAPAPTPTPAPPPAAALAGNQSANSVMVGGVAVGFAVQLRVFSWELNRA